MNFHPLSNEVLIKTVPDHLIDTAHDYNDAVRDLWIANVNGFQKGEQEVLSNEVAIAKAKLTETNL